MSLAGAALKHALSALAPHQVLLRGSRRTPQVALTFDDGPHPEHTPRILDALQGVGASATFFVQGSNAAQHKALVRDIHTRGHCVANHAATHRSPSELGTRAYVREVFDTQALLDDIVGSALPRHFRPPYGITSIGTFARLAQAGYRFVFWSRDSKDSWLKEPAALLDDFDRNHPTAGEIVLFHDDYAHTAAALPELLRQLSKLKLTAVSVEELPCG